MLVVVLAVALLAAVGCGGLGVKQAAAPPPWGAAIDGTTNRRWGN